MKSQSASFSFTGQERWRYRKRDKVQKELFSFQVEFIGNIEHLSIVGLKNKKNILKPISQGKTKDFSE